MISESELLRRATLFGTPEAPPGSALYQSARRACLKLGLPHSHPKRTPTETREYQREYQRYYRKEGPKGRQNARA